MDVCSFCAGGTEGKGEVVEKTGAVRAWEMRQAQHVRTGMHVRPTQVRVGRGGGLSGVAGRTSGAAHSFATRPR